MLHNTHWALQISVLKPTVQEQHADSSGESEPTSSKEYNRAEGELRSQGSIYFYIGNSDNKQVVM